MCNLPVSLDTEEVKKNLNANSNVPYPPAFLVIIPPIIVLVISGIFLIYLGSSALLDLTFTVFKILSGIYEFDVSEITPITTTVNIGCLLLGSILIYRASVFIRYRSIANKKYTLLLEKGAVEKGIITSHTQLGNRNQIIYTVTIDSKLETGKFITDKMSELKLGDVISVCWYDKYINIPVL